MILEREFVTLTFVYTLSFKVFRVVVLSLLFPGCNKDKNTVLHSSNIIVLPNNDVIDTIQVLP